ncbi:hypothetical protein DQ04_00851140 [Trypanosoma grayi]|uniref:hypothetical protein n=1 Tax=Trypanosoma grayi TaxID=71804 RepID=UPI0004F490DE|nr:hypothetical protein DQ04_00851140 [Trypanosoma grayi]KEG13688.1 hypothetical protein DQ04_00851140 [Trypanosoma grayi]
MQVDLSHRNLIDFDSSAFCTEDEREALRSITRLDISFNSISSLHGLHWLSTLTALDVSHNSVASLRGLPLPLRQLNASFNVLSDVECLSPLLQLEVLVISHNQITGLRGIPATVRILDASSNRLTSLAGVERCAALEELQVRQNMIQRAEGLEALNSLHLLKALTITGNPVTCSRRHISAVYAMLPVGLQVVDLPSTSTTMHSSTVSTPNNVVRGGNSGDISPAASLNTNTAKDTINISGVSSASTAKTSQDVSSHGSHAHPPASYCLVSPQKNGVDKDAKQERQSGNMTPWLAEGISMADLHCSTLPESVPLLSGTAASSSVSVSRNTSIVNSSRQVASTEVDVSVPSIRAQRLTQSALECLQSELDECRRMCSFYNKENAELRLSVQQLRSTNERLVQANSTLLERNRQLQLACASNPSYRQELDVSGSPGEKNVVDNGPSRPSSIQQLVKLSHDENNGVEVRNSGGIHCQVEDASGEAPSLEEKAELRRGARSLAALFMSLVPTAAATQPSSARSFSADVSGRDHNRDSGRRMMSSPSRGTYTNNSHSNSISDSQLSSANGGRRKRRTVSFGGFAYYSPPQ